MIEAAVDATDLFADEQYRWDRAIAQAVVGLYAAFDAQGEHWVTIDGKAVKISAGGGSPISPSHIHAAAQHFGISPVGKTALLNAHSKGMIQTDKQLMHSIAIAHAHTNAGAQPGKPSKPIAYSADIGAKFGTEEGLANAAATNPNLQNLHKTVTSKYLSESGPGEPFKPYTPTVPQAGAGATGASNAPPEGVKEGDKWVSIDGKHVALSDDPITPEQGKALAKEWGFKAKGPSAVEKLIKDGTIKTQSQLAQAASISHAHANYKGQSLIDDSKLTQALKLGGIAGAKEKAAAGNEHAANVVANLGSHETEGYKTPKSGSFVTTNGQKVETKNEEVSPVETHAMPSNLHAPLPKNHMTLPGQSFKPGTPGSSLKTLNGIAITPLNKMGYMEAKHADIHEPPIPSINGKWNSAGVVLTEPDGRLWIRHPKGNFGGDQWTFAKGMIDSGLTAQQTALKEVQEENGLNASINGYLGDYEGSMSTTRYYVGRRTGGDPTQYEENETDDVRLVTMDEAKQMMTGSREKKILKDLENHGSYKTEGYKPEKPGSFVTINGQKVEAKDEKVSPAEAKSLASSLGMTGAGPSAVADLVSSGAVKTQAEIVSHIAAAHAHAQHHGYPKTGADNLYETSRMGGLQGVKKAAEAGDKDAQGMMEKAGPHSFPGETQTGKAPEGKAVESAPHGDNPTENEPAGMSGAAGGAKAGESLTEPAAHAPKAQHIEAGGGESNKKPEGAKAKDAPAHAANLTTESESGESSGHVMIKGHKVPLSDKPVDSDTVEDKLSDMGVTDDSAIMAVHKSIESGKIKTEGDLAQAIAIAHAYNTALHNGGVHADLKSQDISEALHKYGGTVSNLQKLAKENGEDSLPADVLDALKKHGYDVPETHGHVTIKGQKVPLTDKPVGDETAVEHALGKMGVTNGGAMAKIHDAIKDGTIKTHSDLAQTVAVAQAVNTAVYGNGANTDLGKYDMKDAIDTYGGSIAGVVEAAKNGKDHAQKSAKEVLAALKKHGYDIPDTSDKAVKFTTPAGFTKNGSYDEYDDDNGNSFWKDGDGKWIAVPSGGETQHFDTAQEAVDYIKQAAKVKVPTTAESHEKQTSRGFVFIDGQKHELSDAPATTESVTAFISKLPDDTYMGVKSTLHSLTEDGVIKTNGQLAQTYALAKAIAYGQPQSYDVQQAIDKYGGTIEGLKKFIQGERNTPYEKDNAEVAFKKLTHHSFKDKETPDLPEGWTTDNWVPEGESNGAFNSPKGGMVYQIPDGKDAGKWNYSPPGGNNGDMNLFDSAKDAVSFGHASENVPDGMKLDTPGEEVDFHKAVQGKAFLPDKGQVVIPSGMPSTKWILHKTEEGQYELTEAKSGLKIGTPESTPEAAIASLNNKLKGKSDAFVHNNIYKSIADTGGSPSHGGMGLSVGDKVKMVEKGEGVLEKHYTKSDGTHMVVKIPDGTTPTGKPKFKKVPVDSYSDITPVTEHAKTNSLGNKELPGTWTTLHNPPGSEQEDYGDTEGNWLHKHANGNWTFEPSMKAQKAGKEPVSVTSAHEAYQLMQGNAVKPKKAPVPKKQTFEQVLAKIKAEEPGLGVSEFSEKNLPEGFIKTNSVTGGYNYKHPDGTTVTKLSSGNYAALPKGNSDDSEVFDSLPKALESANGMVQKSSETNHKYSESNLPPGFKQHYKGEYGVQYNLDKNKNGEFTTVYQNNDSPKWHALVTNFDGSVTQTAHDTPEEAFSAAVGQKPAPVQKYNESNLPPGYVQVGDHPIFNATGRPTIAKPIDGENAGKWIVFGTGANELNHAHAFDTIEEAFAHATGGDTPKVSKYSEDNLPAGYKQSNYVDSPFFYAKGSPSVYKSNATGKWHVKGTDSSEPKRFDNAAEAFAYATGEESTDTPTYSSSNLPAGFQNDNGMYNNHGAGVTVYKSPSTGEWKVADLPTGTSVYGSEAEAFAAAAEKAAPKNTTAATPATVAAAAPPPVKQKAPEPVYNHVTAPDGFTKNADMSIPFYEGDVTHPGGGKSSVYESKPGNWHFVGGKPGSVSQDFDSPEKAFAASQAYDEQYGNVSGAPSAEAEAAPQETHHVTIGNNKFELGEGPPDQLVHQLIGEGIFSQNAKAAIEKALSEGQLKSQSHAAQVISIAKAISVTEGHAHISVNSVKKAINGDTPSDGPAGFGGSVKTLKEKAEQGDSNAASILSKLGPTSIKSKTEQDKYDAEHLTLEDVMHEKIGGQGGSNEGAMYRAKNGKKYYVKHYKTAEHAYTEHAANSIYNALGINAPNSHLFQNGNKVAYASEIVDSKGSLGENKLTKGHANEFLKGFAADCLLGNWDVLGLSNDNTHVGEGNSVHRIDNGGSLMYRAQGGKKSKEDLDNLDEWDTFSSHNKNYQSVLDKAGISDPAEIPGITSQIQAIENIPAKYGSWDKFLQEKAPQIPVKFRAQAAALLEKRTQLLTEKKDAILGYKSLVGKRNFVLHSSAYSETYSKYEQLKAWYKAENMPNISQKHKQALANFKDKDFGGVNRYLAKKLKGKDTSGTDAKTKEWGDTILAAFETGKVIAGKDMVLHRLCNVPAPDVKKLQVPGEVVHFPVAQSTNIGGEWTWPGDHEFKIYCPKEVNACMPNMLASVHHDSESEVMLAPGIHYRVLKYEPPVHTTTTEKHPEGDWTWQAGKHRYTLEIIVPGIND